MRPSGSGMSRRESSVCPARLTGRLRVGLTSSISRPLCVRRGSPSTKPGSPASELAAVTESRSSDRSSVPSRSLLHGLLPLAESTPRTFDPATPGEWSPGVSSARRRPVRRPPGPTPPRCPSRQHAPQGNHASSFSAGGRRRSLRVVTASTPTSSEARTKDAPIVPISSPPLAAGLVI